MPVFTMQSARALICVVIVVLLASCVDESSSRSFPKLLMNALGDDVVTHYGYIDGTRYEASVDPDDLRETDNIASAMMPSRAADLARPALTAIDADASQYLVCGVDLIPHAHKAAYYYIVAFCPTSQTDSVGFRVPVLLSGQVIQPKLAKDQS
jgi:hypothetical protein